MKAGEICCDGWNPWHHPFTYHAGWCPQYKLESKSNHEKNVQFQEAGGYYRCDQKSEIWLEAVKAWKGKKNEH